MQTDVETRSVDSHLLVFASNDPICTSLKGGGEPESYADIEPLNNVHSEVANVNTC